MRGSGYTDKLRLEALHCFTSSAQIRAFEIGINPTRLTKGYIASLYITCIIRIIDKKANISLPSGCVEGRL